MSERASCWVRRLRVGREGSFTLLLCLVAGGVVPAPSAMAQLGSGPLGQYTSPGGLTMQERLSESSLEQAMEDARWRFGGLRVAPYLGIRRAQYHDNVFATSEESGDAVSDLTVTLGAGFDAFLKTGSHVFYRFEVQPDYVFWADLDERNQAIGSYSAGVHAFFNRLTFGVTGRRYEVERIETSEFAQPVTSLRQGVGADLGLRLSSRFSLAFSGDLSELGYRSESEGDPRVPQFSRLDREQTTGSASVVWTLPNGLELGAGWQVSRAEFDQDARALSVDGSGPRISLYGEGNKVDFQVELFQSTLEPRGESLFPEREVEGGRIETSFDTGSRINWSFYGQRSQLFTLDQSFSDFTYMRYGVRLGIPFGDRASLNLFTETGEDDYESLTPDAVRRTDDAFSWGATVQLPLPRALPEGLRLQLGYRHTELDSNLPGLDREFGGPIFNLSYSIGFAQKLLGE
ncbi:MAG TPA: hypothetical protein VNB06_21230 [Thermoanaerobaculia bacterium]|nr:hypothetical protein [Thermoanaerobaculia bacterium]